MKITMLLIIFATLSFSSCTKKSEPEFLYLNSDQLHPLGIELNDKGVFYKNFNPNWKQDSSKYSSLIFYCGADNYLTTRHYLETDTLEMNNRVDSLLVMTETTRNDFYPLLIGDTNGLQSLDNKTLPEDLIFLPVAIRMVDTKLPNRKDTVVVWFKPTEALDEALPEDIAIDDYLKKRKTIK